MKIKLMVDKRRFNEKPDTWSLVEMQGYVRKKDGKYFPPKLIQDEIELEELAYELSNGITCKPALLNGSKKGDWLEQQIFMLDFDHNTTIEEELQNCKTFGIMPVFGYTSFRHSEKEHRFRLAFLTECAIIDVNKRNKLQSTLINLFEKSDRQTINTDRIFFGGKGKTPFYTDFKARIDVDKIISKYFNEDTLIIDKPKTQKPKTYHRILDRNVDYMNNVDAIKNKNIVGLRKLIFNGEPELLELYSEMEVYDFINSIDMHQYLGLTNGQYINCILPEHKDEDPSAHIYVTPSGMQVYKCFGCNEALTIIGMTEELQQCRRHEAINFIKAVYNIKLIQSDWVKEQKQLMIDSANYLDSDEFKVQFPHIAKLIRTRVLHIQKMLLHFTQYVSDNMRYNDKPMFFASYKTLLTVCNIRSGNMTTLSQSLTLFTLLNMLDKVELDNIPEEELKKAKHISAQYGFKKLTNFYQFEEYDRISLKPSEAIAQDLINNNISMKGISREYVLRTFGAEKADTVFPQYKYENHKNGGTSKKSDAFTIELSKRLLDIISDNGYAYERDIRGTGQTETQWKKSIQEILNSYDLVRVKASKANKEIYNLPEDIPYQCFIICKK